VAGGHNSPEHVTEHHCCKRPRGGQRRGALPQHQSSSQRRRCPRRSNAGDEALGTWVTIAVTTQATTAHLSPHGVHSAKTGALPS